MASALKRGCRFIVILFALLLAVAVGAGLWLWQGHRGFAYAPIGGATAGVVGAVLVTPLVAVVKSLHGELRDRSAPAG